MDKYLQEIEKTVQQAAINGTLTKEAVDMFHGILEENAELTEKNESQRKQLSSVRDDLGNANRDLGIANGLVQVAAEAEMAMAEREQKMTVLEMQAKYELARVEDHKEMFKVVFRNLEMRRNVFVAPVPGSPDQYGNRGADSYPTEHQQKESQE
jgi:hypothetical protein